MTCHAWQRSVFLCMHGAGLVACAFCAQTAMFALLSQHVPELHIGLRTGYCGSLTTFASWEYSLVTGLIGGAPPVLHARPAVS